MPAPLSIPQQQWVTLEGTLGEFTAPGSEVQVMHLSTVASLGDTGTGSTRLTRDLLPVREMFDVGDLNFDELLQRDLDDHRVATEIIPYLLKNASMVRFFPPILAVIVPAANKQVLDYYPSPNINRTPHAVQPEYETITTRFGGCIELVQYEAHGISSRHGELRFNPDQAKLVVIDGQHRAMAMLAIRREKSGDWGDKGRDFKHFYEDLAADLRDGASLSQLEQIEMPVCICFFPSLFVKEGKKPAYTTINCCRKLFLDVNKNAKRPTKARQLLLDDASLLSAITRNLLTDVRDKGRRMPNPPIALDAFEYDSPIETSVPKRDLAICTVEMLRQLIYWAGFGPSEFYAGLKKRPQGRPTEAKKGKDRFLEEIQFDARVATAEVKEWGYQDFNGEFLPEECRTTAQPRLAELFSETWGQAIIDILSLLHPFEAHNLAVSKLRAAHRHETGHGALAWRALFDGQGVYWTLKSYAEQRQEEREKSNHPEVNIELAYRVIQHEWLPKEFFPTRTSMYLGKSTSHVSDEDLVTTAGSYKVFCTQAFQIGTLMAFAFLKNKTKIVNPDEFSKAMHGWIIAWNQVITSGELSRLAFDRRSESKGFMSCYFGFLHPSDWYWFRYFTFEILAQSKGDFPGKSVAKEGAEFCRLEFIKSFARAIQHQDKKLGRPIDSDTAFNNAKERWRDALKHSVGFRKGDFDTWAKKVASSSSTIDEPDEGDRDTEPGSDLPE